MFSGNAEVSGEFSSVAQLTDIHTVYRKLNIDKYDGDVGGESDVQGVTGDAVIRRLQSVLHCKQMNATHAIGCITQEGYVCCNDTSVCSLIITNTLLYTAVTYSAFVLYVKLSGNVGSMTYYIPLISREQ